MADPAPTIPECPECGAPTGAPCEHWCSSRHAGIQHAHVDQRALDRWAHAAALAPVLPMEA